MAYEIEEGDVFLCTVDRIIGTIVFVTIDSIPGKEGNIVFSEVSPGRIRNIRDFVVPKKKIVCKVLRLSPDRIDLSLRRVTQKEQKIVMDNYKLERSYRNVFKSVLGKKSEELIKKITLKESFFDFVERIKEDPSELEKILDKGDSKKILDILSKQKKKVQVVKKNFSLTTDIPNGIESIRKILSSFKSVEIKFISAGRYSIKVEGEDIKKADSKVKETLLEIEKFSKKNHLEFNTLQK